MKQYNTIQYNTDQYNAEAIFFSLQLSESQGSVDSPLVNPVKVLTNVQEFTEALANSLARSITDAISAKDTPVGGMYNTFTYGGTQYNSFLPFYAASVTKPFEDSVLPSVVMTAQATKELLDTVTSTDDFLATKMFFRDLADVTTWDDAISFANNRLAAETISFNQDTARCLYNTFMYGTTRYNESFHHVTMSVDKVLFTTVNLASAIQNLFIREPFTDDEVFVSDNSFRTPNKVLSDFIFNVESFRREITNKGLPETLKVQAWLEIKRIAANQWTSLQ